MEKLFEQKLQDILATANNIGGKTDDEGKQGKEQDEKSEQTRQAATKKEERTKLQECIDREIDKRKHTLEAYRQMQDVDGMWKMISTTVERAWLRYLDDSKQMKQKTGRGELKLIETKNEGRRRAERSTRANNSMVLSSR